MQTIPDYYKSADMDFHLLERRGNVALFAHFCPKHKWNNFEVHVVQVEKARFTLGTQFPEREVLARSSQWGTYGWTYTDLLSAGVRFTSLTA